MLARLATTIRLTCASAARRRSLHAISAQAVASQSPPRHERVRERVGVPCRSNGSIDLDIIHAPSTSPILLYLPPGPLVPHDADGENDTISALASATGATVACINYRASPSHQFPTPIHDALAGLDWIKENLLQQDSSRPVMTRMGVCGSLLGGSLATMLALTECRLGESRVVAVAVNNPVVDWVFPDDLPLVPAAELPEPLGAEETALPADADPMALVHAIDVDPPPPAVEKEKEKAPKRKTKSPPPTSWQRYGDNIAIPTLTLSASRDVLFRRPEDYFDRFASPIHFFRSPYGMLLYPKQDDDCASQLQPDSPLDIETQMDINHFQSFSLDASPPEPEVPTLARCRAYARIYPQAGTQLSLPSWHITSGAQSPLLGQATELAKMVKRSIAREALKKRMGRVRWHDGVEKERFEAYAGSRVTFVATEGVGLWSEQEEQDNATSKRLAEAGAWMKEALKPESM